MTRQTVLPDIRNNVPQPRNRRPALAIGIVGNRDWDRASMEENSTTAISAEESLTLLCNPNADDGAEAAFTRALQCIDAAKRSIEIHMFVWRNDAIGNEIGKAVLRAADRGVKISLKKDRGAIMYERIEANRKSFFHTKLPLSTRLKYAAFRPTFPNTLVCDEFRHELGDAVRDHPQVELEWVDRTHSKYYLFDEEILITGSVNIEDRHRECHDYMVEVRGADLIRRLRRRLSREASYRAERPIDFLVNRRQAPQSAFEIKNRLMRFIAEAKHAIYVEMACIGDPDISQRLIAATRHGVRVTVLFSRQANIGNDINYRALRELYDSAEIRVHLSDKMVHSKMMLFDWKVAVLGSANLSVFSMQTADELSVSVHSQPVFLKALNAEVKRRLGACRTFFERGCEKIE